MKIKKLLQTPARALVERAGDPEASGRPSHWQSEALPPGCLTFIFFGLNQLLDERSAFLALNKVFPLDSLSLRNKIFTVDYFPRNSCFRGSVPSSVMLLQTFGNAYRGIASVVVINRFAI